MKPIRLLDKDKELVQNALVEYYNERPDEYGMMERPQEVYEEYAQFISKNLDDKNIHILDYGCGSCRIPDTIAKHGFKKVIGLDYFSEEKYNLFKSQLTQTNVDLARYIDDKIPFDDKSFDAISSLCVIEHLVYPEKALSEIDRVLKPGGTLILQCPNWSGINVYISAFIHFLKGRKNRFWQIPTISDAFLGIFRSIGWYFEVLFKKEPHFILIYPNMKNGKVLFEVSDDDAVHLCQPLSFKKFFRQRGYKILEFNRNCGTTTYSKIFNKLFPSFATTNSIIVQKNK